MTTKTCWSLEEKNILPPTDHVILCKHTHSKTKEDQHTSIDLGVIFKTTKNPACKQWIIIYIKQSTGYSYRELERPHACTIVLKNNHNEKTECWAHTDWHWSMINACSAWCASLQGKRAYGKSE